MGAVLSPFTLRVLDVLRDAGGEGLTLREIEIAVGTRWGLRHIAALQRTPGYTIGMDGDRYVLVAERDVGRRADTADEVSMVASSTTGRVSASSSTEPERLFDLSVWRDAA